MYRVAVCDDEPHAAEQNEAMLCQILEARNFRRDIDYSVHCFYSSAPLLAQMEKEPSAFQLLLLDIELENENGLSLAAHLRETGSDCSIVYITAYRDYVFDCFDTRPLHYLLKPVDRENWRESSTGICGIITIRSRLNSWWTDAGRLWMPGTSSMQKLPAINPLSTCRGERHCTSTRIFPICSPA